MWKYDFGRPDSEAWPIDLLLRLAQLPQKVLKLLLFWNTVPKQSGPSLHHHILGYPEDLYSNVRNVLYVIAAEYQVKDLNPVEELFAYLKETVTDYGIRLKPNKRKNA